MNICAVEIEREREKIDQYEKIPLKVDESYDQARRQYTTNWHALQHTDANVSAMEFFTRKILTMGLLDVVLSLNILVSIFIRPSQAYIGSLTLHR